MLRLKIKVSIIFLLIFTTKVYSNEDVSNCKGENHKNWNNCVGSVAIEGTAYVGHFKNGLYHGKGTFTFSDGATYVGNFENGKESGWNIYMLGAWGQI